MLSEHCKAYEKQLSNGLHNFSILISSWKKKNLSKPLQPCKGRAWTLQMLAQVRSSGVTHMSQAPCSVSIMCQHQAQSHTENCDILLYLFNPWQCLSQWKHHRWFVFNYYICFCGNILKSKLILTKEEWNVKVKRKQKYFYYVYLCKSIKCKQVDYFIKHVAWVPQRISELFQ